MISGTPSLLEWSTSVQKPTTLESFIECYGETYEFYGSGKAALYDGLATISQPGENIILPSYLPDAVVEPVHDLDLEARQYEITETLAPNVGSLEEQIDDETVAVMSVNYFGFPQPGLDEIATLTEAYDCYHVDDSAHSALSFDGGRLLGTHGDIGITSLWKLLPVPNGAVLYLTNPDIAEIFEPSSVAGVRDRLDVNDYRFIVKSLASDVLGTNTTLKGSINSLIFDAAGVGGTADPATRYEASKTQMSKLTAHVIADADPDSIRATRRTNYQAWESLFRNRPDVSLVFETLPPGICPQVCPVRTAYPARLQSLLERHGVSGAHQWPRLSDTVLEESRYETARRLAREIIVLPVHQHIDAEDIDTVGDAIAS